MQEWELVYLLAGQDRLEKNDNAEVYLKPRLNDSINKIDLIFWLFQSFHEFFKVIFSDSIDKKGLSFNVDFICCQIDFGLFFLVLTSIVLIKMYATLDFRTFKYRNCLILVLWLFELRCLISYFSIWSLFQVSDLSCFD